ncbi:MAG: divalent-cation tolerance protein CutA [Alcaligenaceae bacterium]|uniref:Divalent-cation tolerance protein CutA n=1 Tax=Paenalcaligenes hermetiae TaxID=1157987 RepID=A0ABP9LT52_9BURK|nr:divalent-cation tolerance protein CutA [Alcaligenaceae bacterium]
MQLQPHSVDQIVLVLSNAPDEALAKRIAHLTVEEGLAACVNLGRPALSMYMWQGTLEGAEEIPLTFKTTGAKVGALMERIRSLHPYEVPEILVLPVIAGLDTYVNWVKEQTSA